VPLYHDQFSRFRGYAFFDSDDPSRLPWTTTKTGVDADNGIWRSTRAHMISMTRPVIDFLNLLDRQNTAAGGWEAAAGVAPPPEGHDPTDTQTEYAERVLHNATSAPVIDLSQEEAEFTVPNIDSSDFKDADVRISYVRTADEVRVVREQLGTLEDGRTPTNRRIGEETFDYYWRNEVER
jgi:hypothetical protein